MEFSQDYALEMLWNDDPHLGCSQTSTLGRSTLYLHAASSTSPLTIMATLTHCPTYLYLKMTGILLLILPRLLVSILDRFRRFLYHMVSYSH